MMGFPTLFKVMKIDGNARIPAIGNSMIILKELF
jgi:hypothetical protein